MFHCLGGKYSSPYRTGHFGNLRNLLDTIFLDHDCTGEQFVWISEIFDDLVEKSQSKALIECFYRNAKRFPEETSKYYLM